jgi:hypothetical protein
MDATDRVNELMRVPIADLPKPARAYGKYLCEKYGCCAEVWVTAFYHYTELVEAADTVTDPLYAPTEEARIFFSGYAAAALDSPNEKREAPV